MGNIKFAELHFDHIVEFTKDRTIFAAAKENGSDHLRLFLINDASGNVYTRNGRADSWEQLGDNQRDTLIRQILAAKGSIPTYRINGKGPQAN